MPADSMAEEEEDNPIIICKTSMGNFKIELYEDEAPITVKNFLNYAEKKFYDSTIFHRIIPNFVIQGGGFTDDMIKKVTGAPIKNEADNGLKNLKGTLSMARTPDINSATSQFFINLKDNKALDHRDETARGYGYAVFGKVIEGWDVIEKIRQVETTTIKGYKDVPKDPVVIKSMRKYYPEDEGEPAEIKEDKE
jgi:cyclophilin family peptidyl-prolyl cis-trans isomerase